MEVVAIKFIIINNPLDELVTKVAIREVATFMA